MDAAAIEHFLEAHFPQALELGARITRCDRSGLSLALSAGEAHLRPGGTVSGPTLMSMADAAAYYAILSRVGPRALAVTSSLQIHFLRRATPGELVAHAQVIKLGRRLAVVSVSFTSGGDGGDEAPVAIATVTYAIPS